jgi:hypothetical protein
VGVTVLRVGCNTISSRTHRIIQSVVC